MNYRVIGVVVGALIAASMLAQTLEFDAASIRPSKAGGPRHSMVSDAGRITYTNVSLRDCLMAAYDAKDYQIEGPDWIGTDHYDIVATAPGTVSDDTMKLMLQKMLNDRFQMTVHREKRDLPVYAMVVGKNGTKLKESETPGRGGMRMNGGGMVFSGITIQELIDQLARLRAMGQLDRPVIDKTGLTGRYDFTVTLFATQDEMMAAMSKGDFGASIFTLIQEQLGLKLEPQKLPLDMVVVDKAERAPTAN